MAYSNSIKKRLQLFDYILLLLVAGFIGYIVFIITVKLNYTWGWETVPQYIFRYDQESGRWVGNYLLHGLFTTLRLSFWSGIVAIVLGLLIALARISKSLLCRWLARCYIELLRNLPPLVIIFIFYFFLADQFVPLLGLDVLPGQVPPWMQDFLAVLICPPRDLPVFFSAVLTLALFESAYIAEIIRAGIESVERHQYEAAAAQGFNDRQILCYIILPQAFRRVLPPLAGQFISLIKDSAIVSVISIQELTYQGTQMMASTYLTIEVWVTVAAMYFLLTFPCSLLVDLLEKRLQAERG